MTDKNQLQRSLTLFDSTMIVMGSMIGSGIFIVSSSVAKQVGSPAMILAAWILTGFLTLMAALSYGELAGMMPRAGGQYVYLREAYNPLVGFLFGWTTFFVIETGLIAAVAIAFAKFTAVLFPYFNEQNIVLKLGEYTLTTTQILALFVILLLTFINIQGIRFGKWVQNVFTVTKIGALLALIVLGFIKGLNNLTAWQINSTNFWLSTKTAVVDGIAVSTPLSNFALISALGLAMIGPIFSSSAWNTITYTAGEIKNPERNIPLSLFLGTLAVSLLYCSANVVYLMLLPASGAPFGDTFARGIAFAANERVGTASAEMIFGQAGVFIMAILIMISTFGCNNGIVLSGARVYYAMAQDGLFFKKASELNSKGVPAKALMYQCFWACLLCVSGKYSDLLKYVTFATLLFYILTIGGVFILRKKQPDVERPYRVWGYPIMPAVYLFVASLICLNLLLNESGIALFGLNLKPSWVGLGIVLLGIPVYFLRKNRKNNVDKV
jgi:basic amino acid/polyamine antiporter, APA family